jgi:hypothetical protein
MNKRRFETAPEKRGLLSANGIILGMKDISPLAFGTMELGRGQRNFA